MINLEAAHEHKGYLQHRGLFSWFFSSSTLIIKFVKHKKQRKLLTSKQTRSTRIREALPDILPQPLRTGNVQTSFVLKIKRL